MMEAQSEQLFINGAFVAAESGQTFESHNPYDGSLVGTYARGAAADIDKAVQAARQAFDDGPWTRMTLEERAACLKQLSEKIEEHGRELGKLELADSGATIRKVKTDVFLAAKQMAYFAKLAAKDWSQPVDGMNKEGVSQNILVREPIGVCAQITPWNFPLMMIIWKLGMALAAGCTVVLKPAEETPASAMMLARLIAETDIPAGVVNIVTGTGQEAGEPLAKHPGVDKIAFTGSTEIGRHMLTCAAPMMKKVTLECGGKSANIILDDADLEMAVDGALFGAFYHAGQCCTAGTRILVQSGVAERFIDAFVTKAKQIHLGNPADKTTDMGPLISQKQLQTVLSYIEAGKKEGAKLLCGGQRADSPELANGFYIQPTVFSQVDNQMTIAQEEIFGPVVSVLTFNTVEEAIAIANDSNYGLAAGVWSADAEKAMSIARQLRAGTVWINEYHLTSEKAAFGGYKQSGIGRELGPEGLLEYTELKHIHVDQIGDRSKKFWYDSVLAPVATSTSP